MNLLYLTSRTLPTAAPQMGGLHPRASLYEKPVNLEAAKQVRFELACGCCWQVGRLSGWVCVL